MLQTLSKPLTLEEFLQLPESKPPGEYIEGQHPALKRRGFVPPS